MLKFRKIAFLLLSIISAVTNAANILACLSSASQSHHIIQITILEKLATNGHNITVISNLPSIHPGLPTNYHHLYLDLEDADDWKNLRLAMHKNEINELLRFPKLISMTVRRSELILKHEIVRKLLSSNQKFDLFVLGYNMNDIMLGIAGHFRIPSVIISTIPALKPIRDFIGNPAGVSSTPIFSNVEKVEGSLAFISRLQFFVAYTIEYIITSMINYCVFEHVYNENFPASKNYPTFDEVKRNVSLVLVNTHFSQGGFRPMLPSMIEIAGVQIRDKPNPLPESIQQFLNKSEDKGVIVFSLGGNIRSSDLSIEKIRMFYNVFSQLHDYVIIWKWESDKILHGKPSNVMMLNWLPQSDLLAHGRVRLFISHCGLGGIGEAKFHGVSILALPIYGDQLINAKTIALEGWAIELNFHDFTEIELRTAIREMLTNQIYSMNVKRMSNLFRDRPMSPLNTAIYWIEYVIRHNGAKHMQSPMVDLNFFQQNSLDVIAFVVVTFCLVVKLFRRIFVLLWKWKTLMGALIAMICFFCVSKFY